MFKKEQNVPIVKNEIKNKYNGGNNSNIALIEPPNLADSEACVFSDFKRE